MHRVLHVDDEPTVRRAIQRTLQAAGLQVDSVENAAAAENALSRRRFDVAVIDREIGADDGVELIGRLAARYPALRLILLSGSLTPAIEERAYELGASRCLCKSTPPSQLVAEVYTFAGGSGVVSLVPESERSTGT